MPTVQRVFSIPDTISAELDANIPNQERSKFVSKTLAEALDRKKREALVEFLDELNPWEAKEGEKTVVEVLREIRESESQKLATHH